MVGIWPLTSYKQALRLNNEVPGISIPAAGAEGDGSGGRGAPAIAVSRWRGACSLGPAREVAGAYLIPPFKRYEEVLELFA